MLIFILFIAISAFYLYLKHVYSYWTRKGFSSIKPSIPFGNLGSVINNTKSFGVAIYDLYNSSSEAFVGIYLFFRPSLLIRDPELIRNILVKDFASFHDRGIYCNEKIDKLSGSLFTLSGYKWKNLRKQLTPTFTSGKLKSMFPIIQQVGIELQTAMKDYAVNNEIVDMKEYASRYTVDIIASVIFGYEINSIENPDNEFKWFSNRVNNSGFIQSLRVAVAFCCPK